MSGLSIQKKINKAMGKVGKKLGTRCDVFHPTSADDPLQQNNYVTTLSIWVEQLKPTGEDIEFIPYIDLTPDKWTEIVIGDFFVDQFNGDVHYLYQTQFNQVKPKAIWCTDRVDVQRSGGYVNGEPVTTTVFINVPVRIVSDSSFGSDHYTPAPGYFQDHLQKYKIYSGAPQGSFNKGDILIDEIGNKIVVTDAVWDSHYIMRGQSYAATSQN
jgi:hypothetical protein